MVLARLLQIITLVIIAMLPHQKATAADPGGQFSGVTITVGVMDADAIGGPASAHAKTWEKRTGGKVKVMKYPFDQLFTEFMSGISGDEPKYDVIFYAPAWIGDFHSKLDPVPEDFRNSYSFDDIHTLYRDRLMKWGDQWLAITVDGDLFSGYYRKDLFSDEGNRSDFFKQYGYMLNAPKTWQEYRDIAEFFTGRTDSSGHLLYGTAEAFARGGQQFWDLFSRAASYTNPPGIKGTQFFDPETMVPQVDNPGWLRAVQDYKEILKFSAPNGKKFGIVDARELFVQKEQAAMALDWGDTAQIAEDAKKSGIIGKVGYFRLPGSKETWDIKQGKWLRFSTPRQVPFLAFGGWVASVPLSSHKKQAAWDFITWFGSPENSMQDVVSSGSGINPYRYTHFLNIDSWNQAFSRTAATDYLSVLQGSLDSPDAALDLRLPGFFQYTEALENELTEILNNKVSAEEGMIRVAARWSVISDKYGKDKQLVNYRLSMGLPKELVHKDKKIDISFLPEGKQVKHKYIVGFSQATITEPWRLLFNKQIRDEVAKHPEIELIITDGMDNVEKQIADVENFISQKVDALLVSPKVAEGLTPVVNKAYRAKIPTFVLDRDLINSDYTQYIGGDNREIGRAAGRYAVDYLGGAKRAKGKIVEIWGGMASTPAQDRNKGFHDIVDKEPGIVLLSEPKDGDWKQDLGYGIMAEVLEKFDHIDLVYAHNDPMAFGAYLAAKDVGREKEMAFLGIDGIPLEGVKWVLDGSLTATFVYKTPGAEAIRQVLRLFDKGSVKKIIKLPTQTIDRSNAGEIIRENELR